LGHGEQLELNWNVRCVTKVIAKDLSLKSGVNVTILREKCPKIGLLTAELLQQSIDFH
jgi:hypothetical protein